MKIRDYMRITGLSRATVCKKCANGTIKAHKVPADNPWGYLWEIDEEPPQMGGVQSELIFSYDEIPDRIVGKRHQSFEDILIERFRQSDEFRIAVDEMKRRSRQNHKSGKKVFLSSETLNLIGIISATNHDSRDAIIQRALRRYIKWRGMEE